LWAKSQAEAQRETLAAQIFDEPAARRAGDAHITRRRLASDSDLGVRAGAVSRILCPSDSASVGLRLKILTGLGSTEEATLSGMGTQIWYARFDIGQLRHS